MMITSQTKRGGPCGSAAFVQGHFNLHDVTCVILLKNALQKRNRVMRVISLCLVSPDASREMQIDHFWSLLEVEVTWPEDTSGQILITTFTRF